MTIPIKTSYDQMRKLKPSLEIDLASATIAGCLKQIRRSNVSLPENHVPSTQNVWICNIEPQHTKNIVRFIEQHMKPIDDTDFTHIKRFRKNASENSTTKKISIATVICLGEIFSNKNDLVSLLRLHFLQDFDENQLLTGKIPNELPPTKELCMKWSNEFWPLAWKGNPNYQDLITAYFNISEEKALIDELLWHASEANVGGVAVCTMIAEQNPDSKKIRLLRVLRDTRADHILQHSVMNVIAEVANVERQRRKKFSENLKSGVVDADDISGKESYLCHNLLIYTTHEPCTMCAMALVHSRIGRLIYIDTHPLGAIESSNYIGDRRDLNWTFDIWRWVGPGAENVPVISELIAP